MKVRNIICIFAVSCFFNFSKYLLDHLLLVFALCCFFLFHFQSSATQHSRAFAKSHFLSTLGATWFMVPVEKEWHGTQWHLLLWCPLCRRWSAGCHDNAYLFYGTCTAVCVHLEWLITPPWSICQERAEICVCIYEKERKRRQKNKTKKARELRKSLKRVLVVRLFIFVKKLAVCG